MLGFKHIIGYFHADLKLSVVMLVNLLFFFTVIKIALFLFYRNNSNKNFLSHNKSYNYSLSFVLFTIFTSSQIFIFLIFSWYHEYILAFTMLVAISIILFGNWVNQVTKINTLMVFNKLISFFIILVIWYLSKIAINNIFISATDIFAIVAVIVTYFIFVYFLFLIINKSYLLAKRKIKLLIFSHFNIKLQGLYLINIQGLLINPINKFFDLFFSFELYDAVLVDQTESLIYENNEVEPTNYFHDLIINFILFLLGKKTTLEEKPNKFLTTEVNGWNIKLVE